MPIVYAGTSTEAQFAPEPCFDSVHLTLVRLVIISGEVQHAVQDKNS